MTQLPLNLSESRRRKERGMSLAASRNSEWIALALEDLRVFAAGQDEFVLEGFRARQVLLHRPMPTNHHAWGALASAAIRAGIIEPTGRYVKARSVKTHAHPIAVYRRAR
jgi:hypothetical protein